MPETEGHADAALHEFGGISTDLKLSMIAEYLASFTKALRHKFPQLYYIDAFAGTGERTVRLEAAQGDLYRDPSEATVERRRGSALIAVETRPPFQKLFFIERNRRHCRALVELRDRHPERDIEVIRGDGNAAVSEILRRTSWRNTRAVMFLDPYGMNVSWTTLQEIRATEAIDVWYLVSLAGLFRQAARSGRGLDQRKRAAITRMLGTDAWEAAWYRQSRQREMFGHPEDEPFREVGVDVIERFALDRLRSLFPEVLPPLRLKNDRGSPMNSLFFAVSNPHPRAREVSTRIADYILNSGRSSQVRPR